MKKLVNRFRANSEVKKFFDYDSEYYFKEDEHKTIMKVTDLKKGYVRLSSHNNSHYTAGDPEYAMKGLIKI